MIGEEIRIYASHYQFHVEDSEPRGSTDSPNFWSQESYDRRLAIGDGILAIGTGTYGYVRLRVEHYDSRPELDLSEWDHVTECGLEIKTKLLLVRNCISPSGLFFGVARGVYRVRACHANLKESEQEVPADWTEDFRDRYLVQFWPENCQRVAVLKQR